MSLSHYSVRLRRSKQDWDRSGMEGVAARHDICITLTHLILDAVMLQSGGVVNRVPSLLG